MMLFVQIFSKLEASTKVFFKLKASITFQLFKHADDSRHQKSTRL